MRPRRFIPVCNKGFTLIELLVAGMIGLVLMGLAFASLMAQRELLYYDFIRTRVNQNLRGAFDILGANIREAGENLPGSFPAVEIIDGGEGPDELILRRNLLDEVLKVCQNIAGGSGDRVYFATAGELEGCSYGDNLQSYNTWRTHRLTKGGSVRAYIHDTGLNEGEFLDYNNEANTGTELYVTRTGTWSRDYTVGSSAVYMIEEWHFRVGGLDGDLLELIENGLVDNPMNVVADIQDFELRAYMQDGSIKDSLTNLDDWTTLRGVEVKLVGRGSFNNRAINPELTAKFFPRNVLSNI